MPVGAGGFAGPVSAGGTGCANAGLAASKEAIVAADAKSERLMCEVRMRVMKSPIDLMPAEPGSASGRMRGPNAESINGANVGYLFTRSLQNGHT